jgi:hypothetical protein
MTLLTLTIGFFCPRSLEVLLSESVVSLNFGMPLQPSLLLPYLHPSLTTNASTLTWTRWHPDTPLVARCQPSACQNDGSANVLVAQDGGCEGEWASLSLMP